MILVGDRMDEKDKDFEQFYKSTYMIMLYYCKAMGQKDEDADEIVDEAFVRIWRAWDRCAELDVESRRKWLYNAIKYIIFERYKKCGPLVEDIDDYIDTLEDEVGDRLRASFENSKFDIYIDRLSGILTPIEYKLFKSVVVDELTYRESANKLGISMDYAYVLMTRIRRKVKKNKKDLFE